MYLIHPMFLHLFQAQKIAVFNANSEMFFFFILFISYVFSTQFYGWIEVPFSKNRWSNIFPSANSIFKDSNKKL